MDDRRTCEFQDCTRKGRNKGKGVYGRFCTYHHKLRNGSKLPGFFTKSLIDNKVCEQCGWDKAPCDRHRRVKENGYVTDNVVILCPNCHRVAHLN
jgi:hypothetical protein